MPMPVSWAYRPQGICTVPTGISVYIAVRSHRWSGLSTILILILILILVLSSLVQVLAVLVMLVVLVGLMVVVMMMMIMSIEVIAVAHLKLFFHQYRVLLLLHLLDHPRQLVCHQ